MSEIRTAWLCVHCGAIEVDEDEPSDVPLSRLAVCAQREEDWGHRWQRGRVAFDLEAADEEQAG